MRVLMLYYAANIGTCFLSAKRKDENMQYFFQFVPLRQKSPAIGRMTRDDEQEE